MIQHFEKDMAAFEQKARREIIQFGYSDLWKIKQRYYAMFLVMIGEFFRKEIKQIVMSEAYQKLERDEDIKIIYGGYMDCGVQIWPGWEEI